VQGYKQINRGASMSGIFVGEYFYDSTDKVCKLCGSPVWDVYGDFYICLKCKKDLFEENVSKQNPYCSPKVYVGYESQKNDGQVEYIADTDENTMIFNNVAEAKKYLIDVGLVSKNIFKSLGVEFYSFDDFYFIDQVEENYYVT
jgi:hypothetical protein